MCYTVDMSKKCLNTKPVLLTIALHLALKLNKRFCEWNLNSIIGLIPARIDTTIALDVI